MTLLNFMLGALWDQLVHWVWILVAVAAFALLIAGIFVPFYRRLLMVAGVAAAVFAAWLYLQHRDIRAYNAGYQDAERIWSEKYEDLTVTFDKLITDYRAAEDAERLRQADANTRARDELRPEVERLAAENEQLKSDMQEMAREADKDPNRDRVGIGAGSVSRIDRSGRAPGAGARP